MLSLLRFGLVFVIATNAVAQLGPGSSSTENTTSLPAGAESWLGRYTGNGIELEFRSTVFGFTAVLRTNGNPEVATPRVEGDRVTGTFGAAPNAVPFEVTRRGSQVRLVHGTREILLRREGTAPPADASKAQSTHEAPATPETADPNPGLADDTPLAQRWLTKLRGKVVRQFWASQGMSSDKRHMLGADGSYSYKSASMVSVEAGGASGLSTGRGNTTGRWRIRDDAGKVFLEVRYTNGEVKRMRITEDNRNWYLNGEKAFAVQP